MLKIRKEQEFVFQQQALTEFETRALKHLRRDLAEQTTPFTDDDLVQRVRQCIARAAEYNLTTQKQIMCFVDASYLLGEDFDTDDRHEWAKKLLRGTKLSMDDKAHLLLATACSVYQDPKYRS